MRFWNDTTKLFNCAQRVTHNYARSLSVVSNNYMQHSFVYSGCTFSRCITNNIERQIRQIRTRSQKRQELDHEKRTAASGIKRLDRIRLKTLFEDLRKGMEEMQEVNDEFDIQISDEEMVINIHSGPIRLFISEFSDIEAVTLTAPKADGVFFYRYDPSLDDYVGATDGHYLREMLARELVYWCKGLPHF